MLGSKDLSQIASKADPQPCLPLRQYRQKSRHLGYLLSGSPSKCQEQGRQLYKNSRLSGFMTGRISFTVVESGELCQKQWLNDFID